MQSAILSCGQIIKEEENNLFGERVFRELQVRVDFTDDSMYQIQAIEMGNLINANSGDPVMIFLGMTLLKDECSKLFLRGSYAVFIDLQKHHQLLSQLITCMNSVVVDNDSDEFQKKADAVTEHLSIKEKETGLSISSIISVAQSTIKHTDSLQRFRDFPSFDLQSFLLSTIDENNISEKVNGDSDEIGKQKADDLSALGIILFALYQQRPNNPPDARFEQPPEPQQLNEDIIPFKTTFLSDDDSTSVLFSVSSRQDSNHAAGTVLNNDDYENVEDEVIDLVDDTSTNKGGSSQPKKGKGGRRKKTTVNVDIDTTQGPPKIAKRPRAPNTKYIPPEATHKNHTSKDHNDDFEISTTKKRGRKPAANKGKKEQKRQPLFTTSVPNSPLFDTEKNQSPVTIDKHLRVAVVQPNSSNQHQPFPGGCQQNELMKTLHEFDKQNAVLRAQLDLVTQNADRAAKIQNETKALCFEILDKGADLTKKGATAATENSTALSTTISSVVAATSSRKEGVSSATFPTTTSNQMMFPVLTAPPPPTIVNLSTQSLSTEESSSVSSVLISSTPISTMQLQQHPVVQSSTSPPLNSGDKQIINPQQPFQIPQTPQHPTVPQFYPTIQVNAGPGVGCYSAQQQQYFAQHQAHAYYHHGPPPPPAPYMPSPSPQSLPWMPQPSYQAYPPVPHLGGGMYFPQQQQPPSYRGGYPPPFY